MKRLKKQVEMMRLCTLGTPKKREPVGKHKAKADPVQQATKKRL